MSAQAFEERRGNGWLCHLVLRSARPKVESELEAGHSLEGEKGVSSGIFEPGKITFFEFHQILDAENSWLV